MRRLALSSSLVALASSVLASCGPAAPDPAVLAAGKTVYDGTCVTCHGADLAGGTGSNITPSTTAGIGGWTTAQVKTAIRTGAAKDGRTLCADMTRYDATMISDTQLTNLVAYVQSVDPVDTVHAPQCTE